MIELIVVSLIIFIIFRKSQSKKFPYASFLFILFYFIYIYMGAILWNNNDEMIKTDFFYHALNLVRYGFISIVLAFFTSEIVYKRKSINTIQVFSLSHNKNIFIGFATFIVLIIHLLYLLALDNFPLITMLTNPSALASIREGATTTMKHFGFFSNYMYYFMPIFWLYYIFNKKLKIAYSLMFINLIILLGTGQKAPLVYFLIMAVLAFALKEKQFNYKKNIFIGLVMVSFLILLVVFQNMHIFSSLGLNTFDIISASWTGLENRVLYAGFRSLLYYVEFFPSQMSHYFFSSPTMPPDRLVYAYANPGVDIAGTYNTVSLGNFYAAFGNSFLVSLLMYILSLSVFLLDKFIFNKMKTSLDFAIYIFFCGTVIRLIITDWYTVLPSFLLVVFSIYGYLHLMEAISNGTGKKRRLVTYGNYYFVLISMLSFLYFFQGQIKGLLLNG